MSAARYSAGMPPLAALQDRRGYQATKSQQGEPRRFSCQRPVGSNFTSKKRSRDVQGQEIDAIIKATLVRFNESSRSVAMYAATLCLVQLAEQRDTTARAGKSILTMII